LEESRILVEVLRPRNAPKFEKAYRKDGTSRKKTDVYLGKRQFYIV